MTDPQTGLPAVSRLLDQQESMQRTLTEVLVSLGRMDAKLNDMCRQRQEQHQEHIACVAHNEECFNENEKEHRELWGAFNRLTTWGKALTIVGSVLVTVLTIITLTVSLGGSL